MTIGKSRHFAGTGVLGKFLSKKLSFEAPHYLGCCFDQYYVLCLQRAMLAVDTCTTGQGGLRQDLVPRGGPIGLCLGLFLADGSVLEDPTFRSKVPAQCESLKSDFWAGSVHHEARITLIGPPQNRLNALPYDDVNGSSAGRFDLAHHKVN